MNFDQGQFNFDADGPEDGYRKWREELDSKKRAFESRWGVILGKSVRVTLRTHAKPLTGVLEWITDPRRKPDAEPLFRLRGMEFAPSEIESMVRVEE